MNDNVKYSTDIERRGAWDAPLPSFNKHKPIVVLVHDLEKEVIEQEFKLDYGSYDDRKFLGRLSFWAINNGRSIETMAVDDWKRVKE